MGKAIELTNKRFGRWVALELVMVRTRNGTRADWKCLCDCGAIKQIPSSNLLRGMSKSCGCLKYDMRSTHCITHGHTIGTPSPTYVSWYNIFSRCYNKKATGYKYWGGRGITICERWRDFTNFLTDMGERPEGKSIDRIDNEGNYEPGNCRWATSSEQNRNKRRRSA